jgi:DNA-binding transcriptional MerR regulator
MNEQQFCEMAGLSKHQVRTWLESGLLEAAMVDVPGKGRRQESDGSQLERARLLKALLQKGVSFCEVVGD